MLTQQLQVRNHSPKETQCSQIPACVTLITYVSSPSQMFSAYDIKHQTSDL